MTSPQYCRSFRSAAIAAVMTALAFLGIVVPIAFLGLNPDPAAAFPPGTRFLSPTGSNSNPGTEAAPWRTIPKGVSEAQPGMTIVLEPGTYGARGTTIFLDKSGTPSAPITFEGYPGKDKPTILGFFRITGHDLRFDDLLFNGPTGRILPITTENPKGEQVQVAIRNDRVWITRSVIRNNDWHAGIYIHGADGVRILRDYIHDNGDDGECCYEFQKNSSHGIYFDSGSGVIANNVIQHNLARGVQLHPNAHDVVVEENTIVSNRQAGVQIGKYSANNTIANNIVAYNVNYSIRSYRLTGTGNSVIRNLVCCSAYPFGTLTRGLTLTDNIVAAPRFVGPTDYHLQSDSPAIDQADLSYVTKQDFDGLPRPQRASYDIGAFEAP
jgi:parallel beta-helix repeat protein